MNSQSDADALLNLLQTYGAWDPEHDAKLDALHTLLTETFPDRKVLVFLPVRRYGFLLGGATQKERGCRLWQASPETPPTQPTLARRFSPMSNQRTGQLATEQELRVLVATDVLSEGQNLQDCNVVVNYDLPWAIIRLIQRAGRVDRIRQKAEEILCHSFLPAEGVEHIIDLRKRVRERLKENAEVVGADEAFFEDGDDERTIINLYPRARRYPRRRPRRRG